MSRSYRCWVVKKDESGQVSRALTTRDMEGLPDGWVRVRVHFSSLNYKDALALSGHPGVARNFPLVPGIDAAGVVIESRFESIQSGDSVMIFHADFGTASDGGYSEVVTVPGDWIYQLPPGLSLRQSMILGTAGFTAAQSVDELQRHNIEPGSEILVTGATGGVGIISICLLANLNYRVTAVTGKAHMAGRLTKLGAEKVISRDQAIDSSDRPLLSGRWDGAVDSVGGDMLATTLRMTRPCGCVTACGLVGGNQLNMTVYPFILRGVTLQGIDTAGIEPAYRAALWNRLANTWRINNLDEVAADSPIENLESEMDKILAGQVVGRTVMHLGGNEND